MAETKISPIENELNKLLDEFTNPSIIKSIILKGFIAHTTEPTFKEQKLSEEELTQIKTSMFRIIDFLDVLIKRKEIKS